MFYEKTLIKYERLLETDVSFSPKGAQSLVGCPFSGALFEPLFLKWNKKFPAGKYEAQLSAISDLAETNKGGAQRQVGPAFDFSSHLGSSVSVPSIGPRFFAISPRGT